MPSTTVFSDIDVSFSLDPSGDLLMVTDNNSISQSISNILNTVRGFRPGEGNERYGVGIRNYLFAPMEKFVAESIGDEIITRLSMYEPRIELQNVNFEADEANKQYKISIFYITKNTNNKNIQVYKLILNVL